MKANKTRTPLQAFSVRYSFNQRFAVSAPSAYKWSTDYRPDDFSLMKIEGERRIKKISEDTIILTDITYRNGEAFEKKKLVRLDAARFSWTNTHLTGPNKHSQYLYQIVPEGDQASRLGFTGLQVNYSKTVVTAGRIAELARKQREADVGIWKLLAKEMEKEV